MFPPWSNYACMLDKTHKHTHMLRRHSHITHKLMAAYHASTACLIALQLVHTQTLGVTDIWQSRESSTHKYINTLTPETNVLTLSHTITTPSTPHSEKTTLNLRLHACTHTSALTISSCTNKQRRPTNSCKHSLCLSVNNHIVHIIYSIHQHQYLLCH